ncbi:B-cell receptor CD22-like [Stegastes partitus]|uniref:B-cell receptor CD22-like n=1 Tax=Stegastes partitus TaxID=144197 RepID=A0A9Y4NSZ7_9TELE|nr:PREDICTED: B-cell receptor CD22-like [Stegastes partitus]XP_008302868.1 PREDICTED: B-cell receptor CD22-like [Stegastes partitus]
MKPLWFLLLFLLAGAVGQSVKYKYRDVCAAQGSTVTLPCTFTPSTGATIIRAIWCKNHEICQGHTPSVYDSESANNSPVYKYLGDKEENCTLQIEKVQKSDNATFRFRMEANVPSGHFTGRSGVKVNVVEPVMEVNSSSDTKFERGETVTLHCTSRCSFHQLEVSWFKDGSILSGSGTALQIGPLTASDSGNYTCTLRANMNSLSAPFSLQLEGGESGGTLDEMEVSRVVLFTLHTVLLVVVALVVIKRTLLARKLQQKAEGSKTAAAAAGHAQATP